MRKALCGLFLSCSTLFGASVTVYNDSPFPLNAVIMSADGNEKGSVFTKPQHQATWQDNSQEGSAWSETPYTVIFTCKDGKQFGVISNVGQGAVVTAMQSSGNRYCEPQKNQQDQQQSQPEPNVPPDQQVDLELGPP